MTPVPKPVSEPKARKRMRARNPERAEKMRARNFPAPSLAPRTCAIALRLAAYQRKHGAKMVPAGWSRCWGPVDYAHVVRARGMGACNSSADEVAKLCRGHHQEQEGRSEEFEQRYGVDLHALAQAGGGADEMPPA